MAGRPRPPAARHTARHRRDRPGRRGAARAAAARCVRVLRAEREPAERADRRHHAPRRAVQHRGGRLRAVGVSGRRRARLDRARRCGAAQPGVPALLHAQRPVRQPRRRPATTASTTTSSTCRAARAIWHCELSLIDTAFLIAGVLTAAAYFDADDGGRGRAAPARRRAVPPGRLALGAARRRRGDARLEARERLPALRLGGLQRGAAALRARPRLADPPADRAELSRPGP